VGEGARLRGNELYALVAAGVGFSGHQDLRLGPLRLAIGKGVQNTGDQAVGHGDSDRSGGRNRQRQHHCNK
jgi:hypothetical protein